jgi:hypothetical protein
MSARQRGENWQEREGTGMPRRSEFDGECRRSRQYSGVKFLQTGGG